MQFFDMESDQHVVKCLLKTKTACKSLVFVRIINAYKISKSIGRTNLNLSVKLLCKRVR